MSKIMIPTSFNIELDFEAPEFHKRFFAWLIDFVILAAYWILLQAIIANYSSRDASYENNPSNLYNMSSLQLILLSPLLVYHLLCEIFMNGQSIGKKIFRIKVISETGGRPALHQYITRWLLRVVDFGMTMGLGGLFASLVSKKNQRLGDMAAGTIVIQENTKAALSDTVFLEIEENYTPRYPAAVARLTDKDMNTIKGILDTCLRTGKYDLAIRTADKIRNAVGITEYQDSIDFLQTILKDYNYIANRE